MNHNYLIPGAVILSGVITAGAIFYSESGESSPRSLMAGTTSPEENTRPITGVEITDTDPVLGNPDAPVTIIAFEDFECPFCQRFSAGTMPLLVAREIKKGKAKLVWKDFSLSIHSRAEKAHEAGRCAWEQGKFWEYHDVLFSQKGLGINDLKRYAKDLGLDENQFATCLNSEKYEALVREKVNEGVAAGVSGTPSFFVNGSLIIGARPYQVFAEAIARAEAKN